MTRRIFTLANQRLLDKCIAVIREAFEQRPGSRVEIKGPKRTNDQNAAMWAKLGDIAEQVRWPRLNSATGEMTPILMDTESWKLNFLDALRRHYGDERRGLELVPNIDGTGFVDVSGKHSSDLDEEEMRDLLTIISAFGDQHDVEWSEPKNSKDKRPVPPVEAYEDAR
jgi:hypothetical protein